MTGRAAILVLGVTCALPIRAQTPAEPPTEEGIIPRLNLYLPEGQTDIRLSKLIRSSLFETEFNYDLVSGDIGAYLRYKYYGVTQTLTISGFDAVRFRALETISQDFDRVRGFNVLVRRPLTYEKRLSLLAELDRLTFSNPQQNVDNNKTNVYLKLGYQTGTTDDERSNQISGDPNDRIRNLFTAFREIGPNGRGLSVGLTYGTPVGNFNYVKAEGEALQILDFKGSKRVIGRVHAGFFPFKGDGPPEESSAQKPYRIPGNELFQLDGRDNLKGSKSGERGVNEIHLTLEGFYPVFVDRSVDFFLLKLHTLYLVGYVGAGSLGDDAHVYTRVADYRHDVGAGVELSFSYRKYRVFVSALAARVLEDSGTPRFLLSLRSAN